MNLFKLFFGDKKKITTNPDCGLNSPPESADKKSVSRDFSIEYYPLTDRYYPKYGKYYLRTRYNTGIVEQLEDYLFSCAEYGSTEEEANKLIELFKEQRLKENVKIIAVSE